jgi:hypothetical protein
MLTIQYLIILIFLQICDLFVLLDIPSKSNLLKYNGDKSLSFRSTNSYYTLHNSNLSSSLIDFMRTLYEQEKQNEKQLDYNLIRALAPRIGKIIL